MTEAQPLVRVRDLRVTFPVYGGLLNRRVAGVRAVDGISFQIRRGEVLGLVGESGSGKSTVARAIANLLRPMAADAELGGEVWVSSPNAPPSNVNGLATAAMTPLRSRIQMIFQDPYSSLNPRMSVQQIVEAPLRVHTTASASERRARVAALLEQVGLHESHRERYPHEFSGGQRQRIGIARALATNPEFLIADEPVSALDVSVQAQVLNLMLDLKATLDLTYLFVAHDLSVVHHVADRIAVMYLGSIVEIGDAEQIWTNPKHPYTRALLSAVPRPDPRRDRRDRIRLAGDMPTPLQKPSGCGFRTRCAHARPSCAVQVPKLEEAGEGQAVACPWWGAISGG